MRINAWPGPLQAHKHDGYVHVIQACVHMDVPIEMEISAA
jgi:hypothetical protein